MKFKILIVSSRTDSGVHSLVVEFDTKKEADQALESLMISPGSRACIDVIKLY